VNVAYKLLNRQDQNNTSAANNDPNRVNLGKVVTAFIIFGLLSLLTAWIYSMETETVVNTSFQPYESGFATEVGPIQVSKYNAVYVIRIKVNLASQSWSYIEGQVLNSNKQYLFSFGKELSHYSGYDSNGAWEEMENDYSMHVTFPDPGTYYLKFATEGDRAPDSVVVKVSKRLGSSLPHLWFGIITIIIGIVLNEIKNRTLSKVLDKFES
jgi:hypothetical protein